MILYHFTARERLASIMQNGLTTGDVPVDPSQPGLNAVWLTTDSTGAQHGLGEPRLMAEAEREAISSLRGVMPPPGERWLDKREVRITAFVRPGDRRLRDWLPWARKRLDPQWLRALNDAGGGVRVARTWKLYFGVIPTTHFRAVHLRQTGGMWDIVPTQKHERRGARRLDSGEHAFSAPGLA